MHRMDNITDTTDPYTLPMASKVIRIIVGVLVFVENLVGTMILYRARSVQFSLRCCLINLAVSDMMSGAFFVYHSMVLDLQEFRDFSTECQFRIVLYPTFACSSLAIIASLSVDRVIALYRPFNYIQWITKNTIVVIMSMSWLIGLITSLAAYLSHVLVSLDTECHILEYANTSSYLILSVTSFTLEFIAVVSQVLLFIAAKKHIRRILPTIVGVRHRVAKAASMHLKATMTTLVIVIPFIFCSMPMYGGYLYLGIYPATPATDNWKNFISFAATLYVFNGTLNPIVYCWRLSEVRRNIHMLCCGKPSDKKGQNEQCRSLS